MSYQKLQQASELYMKLNEVNEQIAGLEAVALQVVDGSPEVSLNLSILSAKEVKPNSLLDEDGSLKAPEENDQAFNYHDFYSRMRAQYKYGLASSLAALNNEPVNKPIKFYQSLSDVVTLQILNMIMYEKRQIKKELVGRIKELNLV